VGRYSENNLQWMMTDVGVCLGAEPPAAARGSGGGAFGDFYNFLMKITSFRHI